MQLLAIVKEIEQRLQKKAKPKVKKATLWFFKEEVKPRGVYIPQARAIGKELWKKHQAEWTLEQSLELTEGLFENGFFEDPIVGFELLKKFEKQFGKKEFNCFEQWIEKFVSNWAHCDLLCTRAMAACLKNESFLAEQMKTWPFSSNRWKRRAAIVSFVPLAKKGLFEKEILEIAEQLLADKKDDLVQKGNGWTLREFGKFDQNKLLVFLKKHQSSIPRVTMRYALERVPPNLKKGL